MIKSLFLFSMILFVGVSPSVFASAVQTTESEVSSSMDENSAAVITEENALDDVRHEQWYFLGCVHNAQPQHECEHLAHGYGYHHHNARHDHFRCPDHDHSFACLVRN